MIGTIAVIAAIAKKKKKGLAIAAIIWKPHGNHSPAIAARIAATTIVAAIAELVFLSDRSNRSDHMENRLYCDKSMKRFVAS